jgi:penicillin-binding protein 1A
MASTRYFRADQFDLASQGRRQPGSTFKTFTLAAAVEAGIREATA